MIHIDVLRALERTGGTLAQAIAVLEVIEQKNSRTGAAERQRRKRARDSAQHEMPFVASENATTAVSETVPDVENIICNSSVNSDICDRVTPGVTLDCDNKERKERKEPKERKERNNYTALHVRAREGGKSMISDEAFAVAEAIGVEAGFATPADWPPGWCGAAYEVQAHLNAGCPGEIIKTACRTVFRRGKVPEAFAYFRKRIATFRAELETPLPQVQPRKLEIIDGGKSGTGIQPVGRPGQRFVNGRAVGRNYGSACDAADRALEYLAREAERTGAEPYIPTHLRHAAD